MYKKNPHVFTEVRTERQLREYYEGCNLHLQHRRQRDQSHSVEQASKVSNNSYKSV